MEHKFINSYSPSGLANSYMCEKNVGKLASPYQVFLKSLFFTHEHGSFLKYFQLMHINTRNNNVREVGSEFQFFSRTIRPQTESTEICSSVSYIEWCLLLSNKN
jgi:hypothetical protein